MKLSSNSFRAVIFNYRFLSYLFELHRLALDYLITILFLAISQLFANVLINLILFKAARE